MNKNEILEDKIIMVLDEWLPDVHIELHGKEMAKQILNSLDGVDEDLVNAFRINEEVREKGRRNIASRKLEEYVNSEDFDSHKYPDTITILTLFKTWLDGKKK